MYYRLVERYGLVGYKGLPFGLKDFGKKRVIFYNRDDYEVILMFDGETKVDIDSFNERQKQIFDELKEKEYIKEYNEITPLLPHQEYKSFNAIYKEDAQWSITGSCNYKCKHCFMSSPTYKYNNLTKDELLDVVHQLAECGVCSVSLTGGEPLVSPYFFDIVDECLKYDIGISTIYSNGALVNQELLDKLKERNIRPGFQISFDGIGWHDWLRGFTGAEDKAIKAIKLLQENDFYVTCAMCLHKNNLDVINESLKLLDSLGVDFTKINVALAEGEWAKETKHFITDEEAHELMVNKIIPQYLNDHLKMGAQFCALITINPTNKKVTIPAYKFLGQEKSLNGYACTMVKQNMYISSEGYILPCMSMAGSPNEKIYPNIKKTRLREILSSSIYTKHCLAKAKDVVEKHEECMNCKYKCYCGGGCRACPGATHPVDYYSIDEKTCEFFKNGWFEKIQELKKQIEEIFNKE